MRVALIVLVIPLLAAVVGVWQFAAWYGDAASYSATVREPGQDDRAPVETREGEAANTGTLVKGEAAAPEGWQGAWPQFRGPNRDGLPSAGERVWRAWPGGKPRELWRVDVGEGHAGTAVRDGRVYLVDYDREREEDAIRCLSLEDGKEIWRYTYSVRIKRNHGMSRTTPALGGRYLVALGPKCHVTCLDAQIGERIWAKDLVSDFGTVIPPWYAGQCPLIDGDRVILAPGGDPLMMAVDLASGEIVWRAENPGGWAMTHSSIMPMELGGVKQYVYCASRGVISVAADDGGVLWKWPEWKISIANVPSPIPVGGDRILFTGGYGAGSEMVRVLSPDGAFSVEEVLRLKASEFGSEQQTPILYNGHLYGVAYDGQLMCLGLDGQAKWGSGPTNTFGLGPYIVADGVVLALSDQSCELVMAEADPAGYKELGRAKVLEGHDAWGPMALADGRLLLRDLTELVCLEVGPRLGAEAGGDR